MKSQYYYSSLYTQDDKLFADKEDTTEQWGGAFIFVFV